MPSDDPLIPTDPLQRLHDAMLSVRHGAYYGGWPQVPGPAMRPAEIGMRAVTRGLPTVEGAGVRIGKPSEVFGRTRQPDVGREVMRDERQDVLRKLVDNKDFVPRLQDGRMSFSSLTPAENQIINRIGWGPAPDVHPWQESATDPFTQRAAWERNIRYWLGLTGP